MYPNQASVPGPRYKVLEEEKVTLVSMNLFADMNRICIERLHTSDGEKDLLIKYERLETCYLLATTS